MEFRNISIFYRLLFWFIGISVVIAVVSGVIYYSFSTTIIRESMEKQLNNILQSSVSYFDRGYTDHIEGDLKLLEAMPILDNMLTAGRDSMYMYKSDVEKLFLDISRYHSDIYLSLSFIDHKGVEKIKVEGNKRIKKYGTIHQYAHGDVCDRHISLLYERLKRGNPGDIMFEGPFFEKDRYVFVVAVNKREPEIGGFGGMILFHVDLSGYLTYISEVSIFGRNLIWLLDKNNNIIFSPSNSIFSPALVQSFLEGRKTEESEGRKTEESERFLKDETFIGSAAQSLLKVLIYIPPDVFSSQMKSAVRLTFLVTSLMILIAALIAYIISKQLTTPITTLVNASLSIGKGDFNVKVPVLSGGEMGLLSKTFNSMTDNLQKTTVSRDYMDNIIRSIIDTLIVINEKGKIKTVNEATNKLLGYRGDELIDKPLDLVLASEDLFDLREGEFCKIIAKGNIDNEEKVYLSKTGRKIPVLFSASGIIDARGDVLGIVCIARDISELKQAAETLRESEERARAITETASESIILMDNNGCISYWNPASEKIFGYTSQEIIGKYLHSLIVPQRYYGLYKKGFENFKQTGQGEVVGKLMELSAVRKNGAEFPIELSVSAIYLKGTWHAIGMVRDVTELKQARVERIKAEEVSQIIEVMEDGVGIATPELSLKDVNISWTGIFGYDEKSEVVGKSIADFIVKEERDKFIERVGNIFEERRSSRPYNYRSVNKEGKEFPTQISISVRKNDRGAPEEIVCVLRDISVIKEMEEEARVKEINMLAISKLATLGEVATGIAHEINQPLAYISGFIQNLEIAFDENSVNPEKVKEKLKRAYKQAGRITDIIQHLRTFGRKDQIGAAKDEIGIEDILDNTLLIMGERIRLNNINLIRKIEEGLPVLTVNANQLEQVFINLFQNSIDALKEIKAAEIKVTIYSDNGMVITEFIDNGEGMKKEVANKIFEPFYTTKEVGKGTGLGLSIVYGIIKEHNGTIHCESELNRGTSFTIKIPI